MDEEDEHSPSEFYYPEDLETFDVETETGITESQEAIDDFTNQQKSANTNKKTATDMNTLLRYMEANGMKNEKIESLPASELDHLLSKFFLNARKKNGEEYEPATVSSFQRTIQRYLSGKKYPFNILKDNNEFEKSRKVLAAKRKSLVHEHGKGNKPQAAQAIDEDEEDALFEAGEFGDSNPVALQRTVWWFLSLHFGFRARDESRKLRWGDVQLQQQNDGQEVLVWLAERGTKTRHGQERGHQRAFQPKIYATNTARCPVSFYKKFRSHRPVEMNAPESPFYLAVRHNRRSNEEVWYMKAPLGKNEIRKFLSTAAKNANHSVRKTCISRLLDADVPENFVAQLSGHKSTESLQSYKSASAKHQKRMSLTLSRADVSRSRDEALSSVHNQGFDVVTRSTTDIAASSATTTVH